ncbi:ABC transporter ATP-binding protein [Solibacillus sp. FSL H8-0538]|uniref:ABC transporter ATP-binding protein n=1 Tax=Solibacillus sp. FSL H8-0538 TaxID=2921400 RepID=UPI0030FCE702
METVLELQNVTKKFKNNLIIENISISISANQVTAIVGKNGSGKSTLLKMIGGLTKPDTGQILFRKGEPISIGYVPETIPTVVPFTLSEYLTHMGKIRGLPKLWLQNRINTLLEIFSMENKRDIRIVHFSKGMKQKVFIMQAMLEETDLLIMDEPLSGLDPKAQADLEALLMSLKERNISIILTCHETKLLEKVVDRILIIHERQIIQTSNQQVHGKLMNRVVFELPNTVSIESLKNKIIIEKEKEMANSQRLIELNVSQDQTNKIVKELLDKGASIKLLEPLHTKETEFLKYF